MRLAASKTLHGAVKDSVNVCFRKRLPDKKQIRRIVLEEVEQDESGHCSWRAISRL
jgi:hypothetical protein